MIRNLQIKNFQSHKDTELDFDPGVNVVIGSSDSGKSSIIRSLNWLVFNRPSGDSFRRYGSDSTQVWLNGSIARIKSDKTNSYKLDDDDFKAFGQGIPEEVQQALNLSEINFQFQHDPPFLLSKSPGEIAKYLNQIVNLEKIDSSLLNANRRIKSINTDIDYKKAEIKKLEEEVDEYDWITDAEPLLDELENIEKDIAGDEVNKEELTELIARVDSCQDKICLIDEQLSIEPLLNLVLQSKQDLEKLEHDYIELENLYVDYNHEEDSIDELDKIIGLKDSVDCLLELDFDIKKIELGKYEMLDLIQSIETLKEGVYCTDEDISNMQNEFDELIGDTCPLCGAEI